MTRAPRLLARIALAAAAALLAASAGAQPVVSDPITVGNGRLTVGGDLSATFSCAHPSTSSAECADDSGFFNYTDYEHSALRMMRVDLTASFRATRQISLLGEMRTENVHGPEPYALYVRVRPWARHNFDIQAGRIPPTFGAFARRTYAADNPLIGYPLAYQYLTSLRSDAVPANADELLRMRGRGWLSNYSVGSIAAERGVPVVNAFRWDTGVQLHGGNDLVDVTGSVTTGTLANPLVSDDNRGKQFVGRVAFHPLAGLIAGASAARGAFVSQSVLDAAHISTGGPFTQSALGGDLEYSRGYYLVRFETILSEWRLPVLSTPRLESPIRALATSIEGRYKIRPGLYGAARVDHLAFSDITGTLRTQSWEAPVTRVEVGGGYSLRRNLTLKMSWQHNTRDGGRVTALRALSVQAVYWF